MTHNNCCGNLGENRSLVSLICMDVLFKVAAASTGQVMKIHSGCCSKHQLQGHWIEPVSILQAFINIGKSVVAPTEAEACSFEFETPET